MYLPRNSMSSFHSSPENYDEAQATSIHPESNNARTSRTRRIIGATIISIAALLTGIQINNNTRGNLKQFMKLTISSKNIERQYHDDIHMQIEAGNQDIIDTLGALDYEVFHGREDKIYDEVFALIYMRNHLPKILSNWI